MHRIPKPRTALIAAMSFSVGLAACASDGATTEQPTEQPIDVAVDVTTAATDPPDTPVTTVFEPDDIGGRGRARPPSSMTVGWKRQPRSAPPMAPNWRREPGQQTSRGLRFYRDLRDRLPSLDTLDLPDELRTAPTDVPAVMRQADEYLAHAEAAVAAGDDAAVELAVQQYVSLLEHSAALVTIAGAECGDPTRAANASLNVPVPATTQVAAGLGSVWVSQGPFFTTVTRVDPDSGKVVATIDLGVAPFKIQPADGRMIVRTADSYMAIDPATNSVVGDTREVRRRTRCQPQLGRRWGDVDLRRPTPPSLRPGDVRADRHRDRARHRLRPGVRHRRPRRRLDLQRGRRRIGNVRGGLHRPRHQPVLATTPLPVDTTVPIVLDDAVFFPANGGNIRTSSSTGPHGPSPRHLTTGAPSEAARWPRRAVDLRHRRQEDVLVIDAAQLRDDRHDRAPLHLGGANALATTPDALWVATGDTGILQRFDIP